MRFYNKDYDVTELMKKADAGDLEAMRMFITLCYSVPEKGIYEATEGKWMGYLKKLAAAGDTSGYIWMGDILERGDYVKRDIRKAIELYQKAAEAGESFGYECIGKIYFEGTDIGADHEKAYNYIMKSENKSFMSYYILGEMYRLGLYVKKDPDTARMYYKKTLENGIHPEYPDMYQEFAQKRLEGYEGELKPEYE